MNITRFLKMTAVFAVLHAVICVAAILISFSKGMQHFDHPDLPVGLAEQVTDGIASVLSQPGMSVWNQFRFMNPSPAIQWFFLLLNSLLWGASIAWLTSRRRRIA